MSVLDFHKRNVITIVPPITLKEVSSGSPNDMVEVFDFVKKKSDDFQFVIECRGVIVALGDRLSGILMEGDSCPNVCMDGCGTMQWTQKSCSCATNPYPPCSNCTDGWLECDHCGLTDDENCPTGIHDGLGFYDEEDDVA